MLFNYKVVTKEGDRQEGTIDTINKDTAISSLQGRGFTVLSVSSSDDEKGSIFNMDIEIFSGVPRRDIVIMSRQIATLSGAQVSALRIFRMLAAQAENKRLRRALTEISDDVQGGSSISAALDKHPKIFSEFYVNMVRSGEETGKLSEVFEALADYLDRSYELTNKIRNALIYPAFVIATFIVVMALMLTLVFPNLTQILIESGQEIPIYTAIIIGLSDFLIDYGIFLVILIAVGIGWAVYYGRTPSGRKLFSRVAMEVPILGGLLQKLYLSRIADNMNTLLSSGINLVRVLEITGTIVGSAVYEDILNESMEQVKGGATLSDVLSEYDEIPVVMVQIMKVGEESGELGSILKTLATFYKREVDNAVDTLIGLIEPMLIVALGLGVGIVLTSVLVPIYNVSTGI
ncbi:MAG: type II secretion system F family protein [Candidatus Paceibacterota bacterium]